VTLQTGAGIITSIDHATTGILLSKNGGAATIRHQNVTPSTYDAHGFFKVTLDAIDTDTLGTLMVMHSEPATYLSVWRVFLVVPAQVWDSLFGSDKLDVAVVEEANLDFGALQKLSLGAAIEAFDPPTKAEMDSAVAPLALEETVEGIQDTLDEKLDVAVSTRVTLGTGNTSKVYTVVDGEGHNLAGVSVEVRAANDVTSPVIAKGITGDAGTVTFLLASGTTYYLWRRKAGYTFTNPDTEVVP
jgi:hypothetical protein